MRLVRWLVLLKVSRGSRLIARNLVYHVDPGEEKLIQLLGWSDGAQLTATIESLPDNGQLYQLSQIYETHGYEPKRTQAAITSTPTKVTGSSNRLVFVRPLFGEEPRHSRYAEFQFSVSDSVDSKKGIVTITTNEALMTSNFDQSVENWRVIDNGEESVPSYQEITRSGGLLSYYIYAVDAVIHPTETGDDSMLWHFSAPQKFLGNMWAAYGGKLSFVLSSAEGSFSPANLNKKGSGFLVRIECESCDRDNGMTLALPLSKTFSYDGTPTQFSISLDETAGWLKDPNNILLDWLPPTSCDFVRVLSGVSSWLILGDFTRGYESVALDLFSIHHGEGQPKECYL
uniref:Uncharacterized protein AlNc14C202G8718 n=1 Tax=Albugo laibachii Nc14 TaxID=890382 RepID=F0WQQ8_9STRA|nr:conserved hypothetical protein [Albugo laibachii Nc14]CCA25328.1 conserved hypothetical protein [Albugo laibachii Nc14]|eukprot:CCA25328.1 conserved hypothetical protein [Albugo laibachii Nc14]